ncbi:DsrE/DsrF/TusD sulfur relay family protein [Rhodobacter sp. 24-YEA-8]|uniref:DsrE/DsrF/TusD sulfur relay family protein n=1 Tax=Rhodobacter sp. 24-YEA-8 TaxID=1884310 RepID=UPI0008974031|nr:DsrE family protein [Rhodobacter sp. 24-YEA-8]SEB46543.1 uncharacterized protein involved in oxidation of intracellular sulfur [Rhodobacter sp. 24-YEA-8]
MKHLLILNDAPYGSERSYNGLRLVNALAKQDAGGEVTVFLMADAVACAKAGQKTPDGFYNIEMMLRRFGSAGGRVLLCGTCMDARGLTEAELMPNTSRSTLDELAAVTLAADKVMVF